MKLLTWNWKKKQKQIEENKHDEDIPGEQKSISEGNGWNEVKNHRRISKNKPKNQIVCNGTKTKEEMKIVGASKKKWLYVGRIVGKDIAEKDIEDYLGDQEIQQVSVKKLRTLGSNSAFSIGLSDEVTFSKVFNASFWPEGVLLRPCNFSPNFFRNQREMK